MNAIEVNRLRKTYPGGVEAVRDIDLEVAPGEVFGLLGPNGAGKSTTIGMLTTTIAPTSGTARLTGFDVASEPLAARSVSSVVFQDAVVDRALSGRHYLDEAERLCDRVAIMHSGEIVALDRPSALLAALGHEIVELRTNGDAAAVLAALRSRAIAGDDAFVVGSTLTVPLHDRSGVDA